MWPNALAQLGRNTQKKDKHVPVFEEILCKIGEIFRKQGRTGARVALGGGQMGTGGTRGSLEGRFPLVGAWFDSHLSALEAVDS